MSRIDDLTAAELYWHGGGGPMRGVRLSAYRGDRDETDRIERLAHVYHRAAKLLRAEYTDDATDVASREFAEALWHMHESKGDLYVLWQYDEDVVRWADFIKRAWEAEAEHHVVHGTIQSGTAIRADNGAHMDHAMISELCARDVPF